MGLEILHPKNATDSDNILRLLGSCFPKIPASYFTRRYFQAEWYLPESSYVGTEGGAIVAFTQTVPLTLAWGDAGPVHAIGIGGVCTEPSERGKGHATKILERIIDVNTKQDLPLILFTRQPDFYSRLEFRTLKRSVVTLNRNQWRQVEDHGHLACRTSVLETDLQAIHTIYTESTKTFFGPCKRTYASWQHQLEYFVDTTAYCLVACRDTQILAYMRAKLQGQTVAVIEYGSATSEADHALNCFINQLFSNSEITSIEIPYPIVSGIESRLPGAARTPATVSLMVRDSKHFGWNIPGGQEILFFESDGF